MTDYCENCGPGFECDCCPECGTSSRVGCDCDDIEVDYDDYTTDMGD
jgi:hypothetical protein